MKFTLRRKIIGFAVFSATLPVACMFVLVVWGGGNLSDNLEAEMNVLAAKNVQQIARDIYTLCRITEEQTELRIAQSMRTFHAIIKKYNGISLSPKTAAWEAVNQETGEKTTVTLPQMNAGGAWLGQNYDFHVRTPLIDELYDDFGCEGTIFQRINERGDMLRVASHLPGKDGRRSVGKFIPAVSANGRPSEIVRTVLAGRPYRGIINIWGHFSVSGYEPLTDASGRVFGMIGTGVKSEDMDGLIRALRETKVGKTGYVFVVGFKGAQRGVYIISQNGARDGQNILDAKDANGRFFVREIVETAEKRPPGEVTLLYYPWQNPGELRPRDKIAAITYFEPFDWILGVGIYKDDFVVAKTKAENYLAGLLLHLSTAGAVILLITIAAAVFLGTRLVRPLTRASQLARLVAEGDIQSARERMRYMDDSRILATLAASKDEIDQLKHSFHAMVKDLASLIGQVQEAGIAVTTSATEISVSAMQLESTVALQASSTRQVSASSREINVRSEELVHTLGQVGVSVTETAGQAESAQRDMERMGSAINRLMTATESISSRLSVISDKANRISSVTTTINKISDQTALLSLNAAIEAEKAGEYGKGFSVVAREISRLADRTAASVRDIETMVREMQSSVSSGVMEMDKFADEVRRGVAEVNDSATCLETIIQAVRAMEPQFQCVTDGMNAQSDSARQISEAMVMLSSTADQTRESLAEFGRVTGHLTDAVQSLLSEVSHFRISE